MSSRGLPPDVALVASCNLHPERPDLACFRCRDAISVNRANPGWGRREVQLSPDRTVEYHRYDPLATWSGPDAFVDLAVNSRGEPALVQWEPGA